MELNDNSVITCCSKCQPKPGESGPVHKLEVKDGKFICSNPECRFDWSDWWRAHQEKSNKV